MQQPHHRPHKVLVTGASGSGKTGYLVRFLERVRARCVFVYDHQGELAGRFGRPAIVDPRRVVEGIGEGWCVFDPSRAYPGDLEAGFAWFSRVAFEASERIPGRKYFVCDEIQFFLPQSRPMPQGIAQILQTGRRRGLDVAAISQAPQELPTKARQQLTELVTFAMPDPVSAAWVRKMGIVGDLAKLRPGQYLARNLQTGVEVSGKLW